MIIGVDGGFRADFTAKDFDGAVGDDLIGVHVGLGAGAGLPDNEGEMIIKLAVDDVIGGFGDGVA